MRYEVTSVSLWLRHFLCQSISVFVARENSYGAALALKCQETSKKCFSERSKHPANGVQRIQGVHCCWPCALEQTGGSQEVLLKVRISQHTHCVR